MKCVFIVLTASVFVFANAAAVAWQVTEKVSKIDDSRNVYMHRGSKGLVHDRYNQPIRPTLWIACRENTTSLWINADEYVGTDELSVVYRIDKEKAGQKQFRISNNREAFGLWSGSSSIPFIKAMFGHNTLLVRYTPYGESSRTVEFRVIGLEKAVGRLAKAFHWSVE